MERSLAERIGRLTREASDVVDRSVSEVRAGATPRAAGVYTSSIGKIMGEMAAGILFPIWHEHPDLEPAAMKGPSTYNAREFELSPEIAAVALAALRRAREAMAEVATLLEQEPEAAVRDAYARELQGVIKAIDDATGSVQRRTVGR